MRVFPDPAAFRAWLDAHHDSEDELWVGFYRASVPNTAMRYPDAVDEALCYGWIDGITYRIDEELRAQRFTPRRPTSGWSAVNIGKVAELRAAGRMHPAGIRAFDDRDRRKDQIHSHERPPHPLPDAWVRRFRADVEAWVYWERQSTSYRNTATHWVMSAVKPETRQRRFDTLLEASRAGTRPRPFLVPGADARPAS